ncbi:recombinase RecT [Streptomyces xinghaiensis]|uniref:recombinase RecT n=1 Tax=Streptomyces xinghaiensis TaxID=1038928 RepID=UPI0037A44EDB
MALSTLKDRVIAATQGQEAPATGGRPAPASTEATTTTAAAPSTLEEAAAGDPVQESADAVLNWLRRYEGHVSDALPSHLEAAPFLASVRAVLPSLRSCNPASVLQAVITAARFGLQPDGRLAVITNEFGRAVFIPTYRGYVELWERTGRVASVRCGMVFEGDEYEYVPTAPPPLDFTHKQDPARRDRSKPLFAYAFAWSKEGHRSQVVTVNREEMEKIRDEHSRKYQEAEVSGKRDSSWHTDELPMWQKTAIRQLEKVVPLSAGAEVRALGDADRAGEEGRVQLLYAPDPEAGALLAEAGAAAVRAEGSQEELPAGRLLRKRSTVRQQSQPRRTTRKSRKARGRGRSW